MHRERKREEFLRDGHFDRRTNRLQRTPRQHQGCNPSIRGAGSLSRDDRRCTNTLVELVRWEVFFLPEASTIFSRAWHVDLCSDWRVPWSGRSPQRVEVRLTGDS